MMVGCGWALAVRSFQMLTSCGSVVNTPCHTMWGGHSGGMYRMAATPVVTPGSKATTYCRVPGGAVVVT